MSFIGIVFCFHAWVFFLFVFGCRILVPQLGTEPVPPAVDVQSPDSTGAAREIPSYTLLTYMTCKNGFFFFFGERDLGDEGLGVGRFRQVSHFPCVSSSVKQGHGTRKPLRGPLFKCLPIRHHLGQRDKSSSSTVPPSLLAGWGKVTAPLP